MKNCKCNDTITKKQVDYLGRLAELTVEAALGGKHSLSYRVFSCSCRDYLGDDLEKVFGITELYELRPCQFNEAREFLADWFPDDIVMEVSSDLETAFEEFRYKFVEDMPKDSPAYQQLMEDFIYAVCSGSERPCKN